MASDGEIVHYPPIIGDSLLFHQRTRRKFQSYTIRMLYCGRITSTPLLGRVPSEPNDHPFFAIADPKEPGGVCSPFNGWFGGWLSKLWFSTAQLADGRVNDSLELDISLVNPINLSCESISESVESMAGNQSMYLIISIKGAQSINQWPPMLIQRGPNHINPIFLSVAINFF